MNEKGQVSVYDFVFGFLVFMLLFATLKFVWFQNFDSGLEQQKLDQMEFEANRAIDSMLRFPGTPSNWNSSNVQFIGLAQAGKYNVLDEGKVSLFSGLPYPQSLQLLQVDFNFLFEIDSKNNNFDLNIGNSGIPSNVRVVSVQRMVSYKGGEAIVRLKVFE